MSTPPHPASPHADDAVGELIDALIDVNGDRDAFYDLLAVRPQVLDDAVERRLRDLGQMPGFGALFEAFAALLQEARTDPEMAWVTFDERLAEARRLGEEVEQAEDFITTAENEGRPLHALTLVEEPIEKATRAGLGEMVADLHLRAGQILLHGGMGDRDQEVERAITEFEAGLACAASPERAAVLLMNLDLAGPERVRGDRVKTRTKGSKPSELPSMPSVTTGPTTWMRASVRTWPR